MSGGGRHVSAPLKIDELIARTGVSYRAPLQGSGADTLFMFFYAKQGAQAIRKSFDPGWKPSKYIHLGAASVGATFVPAGMLLPGSLVNTSPTQYRVITYMKLQEFNGRRRTFV